MAHYSITYKPHAELPSHPARQPWKTQGIGLCVVTVLTHSYPLTAPVFVRLQHPVAAGQPSGSRLSGCLVPLCRPLLSQARPYPYSSSICSSQWYHVMTQISGYSTKTPSAAQFAPQSPGPDPRERRPRKEHRRSSACRPVPGARQEGAVYRFCIRASNL